MTKEDLQELAVVAGVTKRSVDGINFFESWGNSSRLFTGPWQPHKDIAQAFEVLEGSGEGYTTEKIKTDNTISYLVVIDPHGDKHGRFGDTLPEAICQAILRAKI